MRFKKDYSTFQEGSRRLEKAMSGTPDRVPILTQMHEFAMKELGLSAKEFYTTPELLAAGTLEIQERYGIDVPVLDYDVYNIEAEAIGQTVIYSDTYIPDVDRNDPLIKGRGDLKKIKTPDFEKDGRLAQILETHRVFRRLIGGTEPTLRFCAPFSLAANIRGIERLIMDIYMDPEFVRELLDRITEALLAPWVVHLKETFPKADRFCGDDASSSLPLLNPDILQEWVIPYVQRLERLCGFDLYVPNWVGESCLKEPKRMLDLKNQVCPGFVEGQDPDVEKLGPEVYKRYAGEKQIPLVLGVGAAFLALSTPQEVADRVRHYIQVGGRDGRFALLLCNIGATTPPENVKAAVAAVEAHGTYGG